MLYQTLAVTRSNYAADFCLCDISLCNGINSNRAFQFSEPKIDWLSMVLRLRQHNIGYTADGFYRSDDPTNSVKALKEGG